MNTKVVYVQSTFKQIGKNVKVKVPTGEKKKGFFGGLKDVTVKETKWKPMGWSDREIDGLKLSEDIQLEIDKLNKDGYDVISIMPITSGNYNFEFKNNPGGVNHGGSGYGYGYGYSYTEGVLIVAKNIMGE